MQNIYDVIIIGSGPSGLTAAIYTTRANLKTLLFAGLKWGGQLMLTSTVENFPGFPDGILGPELMANMRKQAEKFGTEFVDVDVSKADFSQQPFTITAGDKTYQAKSVIVATGADTRWLNVPGEQERIGKGVSSCATCDAAFFRNRVVVIAGGGDSAMEEALVLAKVANSVTVIHRRDSFKASQIMLERAKANPKIAFILNSQIVEVVGDGRVQGVKVKNNVSNEITVLPVDGIFVAIGHMPNTKVFTGIDVDTQGYIIPKDHFHTNVEGVFVSGDVHDKEYRQAVTAAGYGAAAALEVEKYLANQER